MAPEQASDKNSPKRGIYSDTHHILALFALCAISTIYHNNLQFIYPPLLEVHTSFLHSIVLCLFNFQYSGMQNFLRVFVLINQMPISRLLFKKPSISS